MLLAVGVFVAVFVVVRAHGVRSPPAVAARAPGAAPLPLPSAPPPPEAALAPALRGLILDADGNPVIGAAVRVLGASPPHAVDADTKSDAAGRFAFARVGPDRVRVEADRDPDGAVTSAELRVPPGETTEVTLVLSPGRAIRGTVVDGDDHAVPGAALSLEGVAWTVPGATSDADGAFRLTLVPESATSLAAVARGYRTARVALSPRVGPAELVVRVRLSAAPPVEGAVRDPDGNPVRARVVACEGQPGEGSAVSADDGTFELPPSTLGCTAVARHDEFGPSDAVVVGEGHRLELRLKPGGAIEGVVVDERGAAVASFTVGVESFAGASRGGRGPGARKVEDPGGAFRLEKLAPGSYVVTAGAPGRPPARSDPVLVTGGSTTTGVRIVVASGGTVVGRVFDDHHLPLEGVDLRFDSVSSVVDTGAHTQSDRAGQYRLDGAPPGPFTLRAQKDGFRVRMLSGLRADARGTLTQDVTLHALDGGTNLEFAGVGANLAQTPNGFAFNGVFPGGPAERAGLRAGDRIVAIDGESTDGMSIADALQHLRGVAGTSVGVSVQHAKSTDTVDVVVERADVVR